MPIWYRIPSPPSAGITTRKTPNNLPDECVMDYNQLKGRPPFPFETIAVAVAFSPRLEMMLNEARQLARTFKAELLLIHVGKRTSGKEAVLQELLGKLGMERGAKMIWKTGDPVSSLLKTCKENMVDLLILGALRQETVLRYYLGSVARGLSRRAKCSLLLLIEPLVTFTRFQRIVVDCVDNPKTIHTLKTASYFAREVGAREMRMVKEVDQDALAIAISDDRTAEERNFVKKRSLVEADEKLREKIAGCRTDGMTVLSTVLTGRPGYVIRNYADECNADLLAINSPDGGYGLIDRIFTHDMEYILEHLPCNLLIVHSRLNDTT